MTKPERVAMWGLVAGLVACSYVASLRIDTLDSRVRRLAAFTTTTIPPASTSPTTPPLQAAVEQLKADVRALQANRGLSGPIVLHKVIVGADQRGGGIGSRFMEELTALADALRSSR